MKWLRLRAMLLIITLILVAVAVSGCDDWDWLDLGGGHMDTNITTTVVVLTTVTDLDGNPVPNATVFFGSGKVGPTEDVPATINRQTAVTGPSGIATNTATYMIDTGDGVWYGVSTYGAYSGFDNSLYATNDTVFYDDAKSQSEGRHEAVVGRTITLYRVDEHPIGDTIKDDVDQVVNNLLNTVKTVVKPTDAQSDELPNPTEIPTITPTPTPSPGTGLNAKVGDYGMSSTTVHLGDNISAFMDIQNTGGVPIKDIEMVGQVFVYDANKKDYVPWNNMLVKEAGIDPAHIDYSEKDVNIQPGAQYKAKIEKEVPKTHEVFGIDIPIPEQLVTGKYMMIVHVTALDANGKKLDLGSRNSKFEIVGGK